MKLIYLTIVSRVTSYQNSEISIKAFTKLEDAQNDLEKQIQEFKKCDYDYDVEIEKPYCYYHAYDEGLDFTCRNSIDFYIKTIPLTEHRNK